MLVNRKCGCSDSDPFECCNLDAPDSEVDGNWHCDCECHRSPCCQSRMVEGKCDDPRCGPDCSAPDLRCEACGMSHSIEFT